ncbi:MAG: nuclear transport factor 2 family protein [Microcystaceae cyanobacterium]
MTFKHYLVSFALGLGLSLSISPHIKAASPKNAPTELTNLIENIEAAANRQDLEEVLQFYSPDFTTPDGLTYETLKQALSQLWERYPDLQYKTQLQSWTQENDQWIVETITEIQGIGEYESREMKLDASLRSRQYYRNGKLIRQEILQERSDVTSGMQPPPVKVNLPETVKVGESFDFDVILMAPLDDNLLAGTAIEEMATPDTYLTPHKFELQLLQAGGLFKRATSPENPENYWLSAILIQPEGLRLVTRRIRFEE